VCSAANINGLADGVVDRLGNTTLAALLPRAAVAQPQP
jgi:hypothetical protein